MKIVLTKDEILTSLEALQNRGRDDATLAAAMEQKLSAALGEKARRVLEALWRCGPLTALEVRDSLGYADSLWRGYWIYPTLRNLADKGILARREEPGGPERGGRPSFRYFLETPRGD